MDSPTMRQQCLAVAQRFSVHLPEPLEPEDCDELMHYIEDLVKQQLATVTAEQDELAIRWEDAATKDAHRMNTVREQIAYLQTISTAQVQQIRELETELRRAIATINCPEL